MSVYRLYNNVLVNLAHCTHFEVKAAKLCIGTSTRVIEVAFKSPRFADHELHVIRTILTAREDALMTDLALARAGRGVNFSEAIKAQLRSAIRGAQ